MNILILGGDGYLGWPTAMHLSRLGHQVLVADNYFRRDACKNLGLQPLISVPSLTDRTQLWQQKTGHVIYAAIGDITNYTFLEGCFTGTVFGSDCPDSPPDAVIHYAEQPSAPYSMMGRAETIFTLRNNLEGTANLVHAIKEFAPNCHLIKLGTMGVYGTPNIDIEEGYLTVTHNQRSHTFLYPKTPGSVYHLTKAQDSDLLYFYCRMWDIRVTDLNQGPVYGIFTNESREDEALATIFNYDAIFGTVLNRFITQAVAGIPLTVYGKGGQARGYININDTIACVQLAMETPPEAGAYRVFNQFVETFTVNELAAKVGKVGNTLGLAVNINHIDNPRKEEEEHYYNPVHSGLLDLGLQPHYLTDELLAEMIKFVIQYREAIHIDLINPTVKWR